MMHPTLFLCAAAFTAGCGGGGCGGGGGTGGGTGSGSGQPNFSPDQFFKPSRYQHRIVSSFPLTNATVVLDTTMPPAALAEAAAGLSAWVETRATSYRFSLIASDGTCGPGEVRVPLPPSDRDVKAELLAAAAQIKASLASIQPTTMRSTMGALAGRTFDVSKHSHQVWLITSGADQCGPEVEKTIADMQKQSVYPVVLAFQPDPAGEAWLNTLTEKTYNVLYCPSRSDAECGPDNVCADHENAQCRRTFRTVTSGAALTQLLLDLTFEVRPLPNCDQFFYQLKGGQRPSRVFLDGVELKTEWTFDSQNVRFTGAACEKILAATNDEPVTVEVEVPFSLSGL